MMKRVVVVGSGPSALATVRALFESNLELEVFVIDIQTKRLKASSVGLKSHFGSTDVYDNEESQIFHSNMKPVVWPSSGLGGYSRIWGAVIGSEPSGNFPKYLKFGVTGDLPPFSTKSAHKLLKKYKHAKEPRWLLKDHYVAIDPTKCIMCGDCLTGCPTGAIWFAGNEWEEFPAVKKDYEFRVKNLEIQDKRVKISSFSGKNLMADLVFLAAGAIASSQILMRSNLIPNKVSIKDTSITFFPALRLPIRENNVSFSLSQLSASLQNSETSRRYIQLYPDSRKIIDPLTRHLPRLAKVLSKCWKAISPFVLTGILYKDVNDSPSINLEMKAHDYFVLSPGGHINSQNPKTTNFQLARSLHRDFGIIPLFFLGKKGDPGESYHFGGINEVLELNNQSTGMPIKTVDSSALSIIEPGPITDQVMKNARGIVNDALKEFYEISN